MPFLADALDPARAEPALRRALPEKDFRLREATLFRHKPGRRALVSYELDLEDGGTTTVLGKARAKGLDEKSFRVQKALREEGQPAPEPLGVVSGFHMWLQRKVAGVPATEALAGPGGRDLAWKIAGLAHGLHGSRVRPLRRPHGIREELQILHRRLPLVAAANPRWEKRIERVLKLCDRVGKGLRQPEFRPVHRDFYPDQVLVDGDRLWLLDLDLYCPGDPALDIGNFAAHLTEHGLRTFGDPDGLRDREAALEEGFAGLAGEESIPRVRAYAALTLARHIHISTRFPERRPFTGELLGLSEERLESL
jgi:hypothetical protein